MTFLLQLFTVNVMHTSHNYSIDHSQQLYRVRRHSVQT